MNLRHEWKHSISAADLLILRPRLRAVMRTDPHAEGGSYEVRSLYFDDYDNRCMQENENGTDPREKFRIRLYNGSTEKISLECKRKERGKTYKTSCPLTVEQTR